MFHKKQTPTQQGRMVRERQTAKVFSYYANRSPGEQTRRMDVPPLKRSRLKRNWAAYTPSFLAGLALVLCLGYVSTLDPSPKLQVVGDQRETGLIAGINTYQKDVQAVFGESMVNRSKLLIDTDKVAKKLHDKFPELGEVAIILPLVGRRPIVQVQPAKPALILGTFDGGMVVDENGRIVANAHELESSVRNTLPVLQDESGLSLTRGNYAMTPDATSFVRMIWTQLAAKKYRVQSMTLPTVANEMHLRLEDKPYYIKFDIRGDGRVQAGTFIATKEKLENDHVTPREYIDVRVPGKAYYK